MPRVHPTGLTPIDSPVHHQQAEIVERLNEFEEPDDDAIDETAEIYEPEAEEIPVVPARKPALTAAATPQPALIAAATPQPAVAVGATAQPAPRGAPRVRAAVGSKGKAAFTLRLDPGRHLKLRLACAVDGRSAQQLVTDALDQLLERMPDLDGLAAKAKNRG